MSKKLNVPASIKELKNWAYIFKVLGDEIRLNILKEIIDNPGISGKEILINLKLSQPTLSFHLKHLQAAQIVEYKKTGQTHCYYPKVKMITTYHELVKSACDIVAKSVIDIKKNK